MRRMRCERESGGRKGAGVGVERGGGGQGAEARMRRIGDGEDGATPHTFQADDAFLTKLRFKPPLSSLPAAVTSLRTRKRGTRVALHVRIADVSSFWGVRARSQTVKARLDQQ